MKKTNTFEIPQDILDITRQCHCELTDYHEFDISITVNKEGEVMVRDMLGLWADERFTQEIIPAEAWSMIRAWWKSQQDRLDAVRRKTLIEQDIVALQKELNAIDRVAEKKKWFWQN